MQSYRIKKVKNNARGIIFYSKSCNLKIYLELMNQSLYIA